MKRLFVAFIFVISGCAAEPGVPRFTGERLPAPLAATHLVFRAYVDEFTVSVGGQRIYAFRDPHAAGRLTLHVAQLPPHSAGKTLVFDVAHPPDQGTQIGAVYLADDATLPIALNTLSTHAIREDLPDITLGLILVVIGAMALAASLIRRRGDVLALRAFGAFTLLYGMRMLYESSLPYFFGASVRQVSFTTAFITYVIPIAGWALPLRFIGNGWKNSLRLQVIAFVVFAPIGIASDFITGRPFSMELANNVLVIAGGINILGNLLRAEHRRSHELRIVLGAALIFMLFALNNNLNNLGMLPWEYDDEAPGFVLFVAALGFAATRAFLRGEREGIAIENELRTAREIQQSILPRAMPSIAGVHFETGYVPATSVGGDMYSFLERDGGAGVLVADVAGHGVPAALIASMVKIAVSSQARLANDPAALMTELDAILRRDVRRAFVTATYLWLDGDRLTVANAGHPPPLLYRDGAFEELGGSGVLLGRFPNARFTAKSHELRKGDRIVAYTDGIPEARNGRGEQFGEERLREQIASGASADAILDAVQRFRTNEDADDLTIVIVRYT